MKRIAFLLVFLTLFGMQASARAETGPGLLQRIAAIDGATTAFVQQGDILYAATGIKISVYDVGDPAQPRHLADSPLMSEAAQDLALADDLLFVADDIDGLWIFRILPDHQLQVAQHLFTNAIISHVVANNDRVYVAGWGQGEGFLAILEASDKGVSIVGHTRINPDVSAMDVSANTLFIIDHASLHLYDVSDPAHVRHLGRYNRSDMDEFSDMQVKDGVAYILAQQVSGLDTVLITVDVNDPTAPHELAFVDITFSAWALSLQRNILYLAGVSPGIHMIDISDPANPQMSGAYHAMATALLASPTLLFTSNGTDDIEISDISDPTAPQLVGFIPKLGQLGKMISRGDRLYALTDWNRFSIFDISDPAHPHLLGAERAGDGADIEDFVVADDIVYQAFRRFDSDTLEMSYALRVLDITDPAAPTEIARYPLTTDVHRLAYAAPYLYLATDIHLLVFDVSDPSHPDFLSFAVSSYTLDDMLASDGALFTLINNMGLKIWDVTDPYLPEHATFFYTPGRSAWELEQHGEQIIIADGRGGLAFVDVSQVDKPVLQTAIDCDDSAQNVAVAEDMLFAVCHDLGRQLSLHAYDLSDPEHPQARAATLLKRHQYILFRPQIDHLTAAGDTVFFNAGDAGLQVFRYLPPARARHLWLPSVHLPAASPFLSPAPTPTPATPSSHP